MLLSMVLFALGTAYELARFLGVVKDPMPNGFVIPLLGLCSTLSLLRWVWLETRNDEPPLLSEEMLREYAYHDPLTKLPNRLLLKDRLTFQLAALKRTGSRLALHMIDLDGFKQANDTMGHRTGDELLVQVGYRLRAACRETDTVARLGGDEFVILQQIDEEAQAAILGNRIVDSLSRPFYLPKGEAVIGCSVGVTVTRDPNSVLEDLIDQADSALYQSKSLGGNTLTFFQSGVAEACDGQPLRQAEPQAQSGTTPSTTVAEKTKVEPYLA